MLHHLQWRRLAGDQHCSRQLKLPDRFEYRRFLSSEAILAHHGRRRRRRIRHRNPNIRSARTRFNRRLYRPFQRHNGCGCLGSNRWPQALLCRASGCPRLLHHQPPGIQNSNSSCAGQRSHSWGLARTFPDVAHHSTQLSSRPAVGQMRKTFTATQGCFKVAGPICQESTPFPRELRVASDRSSVILFVRQSTKILSRRGHLRTGCYSSSVLRESRISCGATESCDGNHKSGFCS